MESIVVPTTVIAAEVYRRGCSITCRGEAPLVQGQNTLLVKGLPEDLDEASILLRMPATVELGQVHVLQPDADKIDDEAPLVELIRQSEALDGRMENLKMEQEAWKSAAQSGGTAAVECLVRLPQELERLSSELTELSMQRRALDRQIEEAQQSFMRPSLEVTVTSAQEGTTPFELVYRSASAGWRPTYDVLVDKVGDSLRLRMKAEVWQQTGTDWDDVALRLSTGSSLLASDMPRFSPCYLGRRELVERLQRPMGFDTVREMSSPSTAKAKESPYRAASSTNDTIAPLVELSSQEAQVSEQATVTVYQLEGPQSLPSSNDGQVLTIATSVLEASYYLYTYPRKGEAAYLVARLAEEPGAQVLGQPLAVYLEGSYVGSLRIGRGGDEESYELPLGRDDRVRVRRSEEKHRSKRLLSNRLTVDYSSTITIENRKPEGVDLVVLEQVPISSDKDIEVNLRETSNAAYDQGRGELRWKRRLEAGERVQLEASYSVSRPQSLQVEATEPLSQHPMDWRGSRGYGSGFCPCCGMKVEPGSPFCIYCGAPLH